MKTEREKLDDKIDKILKDLNINIAVTKRGKFKEAMFNVLQDKYLELDKRIRKEISPHLYKKDV